MFPKCVQVSAEHLLCAKHLLCARPRVGGMRHNASQGSSRSRGGDVWPLKVERMVRAREGVLAWPLSYVKVFLLSRQVEGMEGGGGSHAGFNPHPDPYLPRKSNSQAHGRTSSGG